MSALSGIDIALWDLKGEFTQTNKQYRWKFETSSHVIDIYVVYHVTAPFTCSHVPGS
jgi:hypothetical protein